MRRIILSGSLVLLALTAAGCGGKSTTSESYSGSASPMACTHWNNIVGDVHSGILTDAELRSKVSEVRDAATDPTVEAAATKLLSGITHNNEATITAGANALQAACQ